MAGSRLDKIGTIYWRVTGLLRANVMKDEDKPIWYNVYRAFPPKHEPRYDRPVPTREIPDLFYPEDRIRAKFYKTYGSPGVINMASSRGWSISQRFVERYTQLESQDPDSDEWTIFQKTEDSLAAEGVHLVPQKHDADPAARLGNRKLLYAPIPAQNPVKTGS